MPRISRYKWEALAERAKIAWHESEETAVAIDTETTGHRYHDTAFCATVCWGEKPHYFELSSERVRNTLAEILTETQTWVFHNAKFDLHKLYVFEELRELGESREIEDTEALAHLLDEHQNKSLKELARKYLGEETNEEKHLRRVRKKLKLRKADGYHKLPREVVIPYALKDAEFTWNLWRLLRPQVERHEDLLELYRLEMRLTRVLLSIEEHGLGLCLSTLQSAIKNYGDQAVRLESAIASLVGKPIGKKVDKGEFNPNSHQQVYKALAARGQIVPDTQESTLSQVPDDLAACILEYRSVQKLRNTYLIPMMEEQRDGVLHPNFRQHRTKTGRMASGAYKE